MIENEIAELLRHPGARVVAFDALGAKSVPVPEELRVADAARHRSGSPTSTLSPESMGKAIAVYERARRSGRASTTLTMAHDGSSRRLELFDLTERFGCFVGVVFPTGTQLDTPIAGTDLTPRRAVFEVNATGVILGVTPEFTAMLGHPADQIVGTSSLDLIHPDDHEAAIVAWIDMLEHPHHATRTVRRYRRSTGRWLWCEATNQNRLNDPERPRVLAELVDVSREMAAQAALQRREALLDQLSQALPTGLLYLDQDGSRAFHNDRWIELTGMDVSDRIEPLLDQVEERDLLRRALEQAIEHGINADLPISFVDGASACRYGSLHLRPLRERGTHVGLLVTLDDRTATRTLQMQLADQTRRDPLTSAYNRVGIEEALEARLADRTAGEGEVAVLFIDLDRFKAINDTHGHSVGDQVLCLVAERIGAMTRDGDALGRIGGDEFVVILGGATTAEHAQAMAKRIGQVLPELESEFDVDISIAGTVGVAFARDGDGFDSLMKRADAAMYEGKKRRGGVSSHSDRH